MSEYQASWIVDAEEFDDNSDDGESMDDEVGDQFMVFKLFYLPRMTRNQAKKATRTRKTPA